MNQQQIVHFAVPSKILHKLNIMYGHSIDYSKTNTFSHELFICHIGTKAFKIKEEEDQQPEK